jgi:RNA polymerase sigma-70 factor (ECF subfamily)
VLSRFPTTQWDCLAAAADPHIPGADAAVAEICRVYWYPIYSYIRARGHDSDRALDLTQDYFVRLLEGRLLEAADRRKGRFRNLLRTDCGFFLSDRGDQMRSQKRGGGRVTFLLDADLADRRYRSGPRSRLDAERLFDRAWALDVLQNALERLERSEKEAGRGSLFECFRSMLVGDDEPVSYRSLAEQLSISESAVDGALRRMRKRFRDALRATVLETLSHQSESEVDDEICDLFAALRA